jgi:hypothetical protein
MQPLPLIPDGNAVVPALPNQVDLDGPDAPDFCPGGQTETLDVINYRDIKLTDTDNNVSATATPSKLGADPSDCPSPLNPSLAGS